MKVVEYWKGLFIDFFKGEYLQACAHEKNLGIFVKILEKLYSTLLFLVSELPEKYSVL